MNHEMIFKKQTISRISARVSHPSRNLFLSKLLTRTRRRKL
jgi:hypothetical protein